LPVLLLCACDIHGDVSRVRNGGSRIAAAAAGLRFFLLPLCLFSVLALTGWTNLLFINHSVLDTNADSILWKILLCSSFAMATGQLANGF
jgi:hypothetical protein